MSFQEKDNGIIVLQKLKFNQMSTIELSLL